jgi:hypothetical protein
MAKSYRKRSHVKSVRKHKGRKGNSGRKSRRRSTRRRSRRGGLSLADMKTKASSMGSSTMGKVSFGLGSAKNGITDAYNKNFGKTQALDAAGRSNAGVPTANQYGSPTLISTSAPTMPHQ